MFFSVAPPVGHSVSPQLSCFQKILNSKWTDVALVVSAVVLVTISSLIGWDIIHFVGTTGDYIAITALVGGGILCLIEFGKMWRDSVKSSHESVLARLTTVESVSEVVAHMEIDKTMMRHQPHTQNTKITLFNGEVVEACLTKESHAILLQAIGSSKCTCVSDGTNSAPQRFPQGYLSKVNGNVVSLMKAILTSNVLY